MNNPPSTSNCAVSQPILYPNIEILQFNGFAWSNSQGIILQSQQNIVLGPDNWLGNQE
jgi:hypothetical protein